MKTQHCFTLLLVVRLTIAFTPNAQLKYRNGLSNDRPISKMQASVIYDWDTDVDLIADLAADQSQISSNFPSPAHTEPLHPKSSSPSAMSFETLLEAKDMLLASIAAAKVATTNARDVIYPRLPEVPQLPNIEEAFNGITDLKTKAIKFLETKSRPKRKPVSMHSTISTIAAGSYLTAYLPFFHPGLDHDGFLQIFDFYQPLSVQACHQIQFGVDMLALSGILGYFRIPPKAPPARRLPFTLATSANIFFALTLSSSLNALPEGYWHFDAFSGPGMGLIAAAFFGTAISMISALDNAICGPNKGLHACPGGMNRGTNILFASLIFFFVNGAQVPLVAPMFFSNLDAYQQSISTAFESVGMASLDFHSFATAVGFVSFLSFVATLQFEKKISETMGMFSFVSLFLVFNCDAIVATYKTMFCPDLLPILESSNFYISNIIAEHHLIEGGAMVTGLVVLNAVRKLLSGDGSDKDRKSNARSAVPTLMMKD